MKNVYDMVSGEFIEDEPCLVTDYSSELCTASELALQLQPVEIEHKQEASRLPADMAFRIFFND